MAESNVGSSESGAERRRTTGGNTTDTTSTIESGAEKRSTTGDSAQRNRVSPNRRNTTPSQTFERGPEDSGQRMARGGDTSSRKIIDRMRDQANAELAAQKNRALDGLGGVARAVRKTTDSLREQRQDTLAEYVDEAVNQIERWSEHLKSRDFSDLIKDTERLIRRQPALFIGSAFVIGLFGARFFKSSAQNDGSNARVHGAFPGRPSDRRPYGNTAKRPATGSTRPSTTSADEFSTEGL